MLADDDLVVDGDPKRAGDGDDLLRHLDARAGGVGSSGRAGQNLTENYAFEA